jgi:hypothetical protein
MVCSSSILDLLETTIYLQVQTANVSNICTLAVAADEIGDDVLVDAAVRFMVAHIRTVTKQATWRSVRARPNLVKKLSAGLVRVHTSQKQADGAGNSLLAAAHLRRRSSG